MLYFLTHRTELRELVVDLGDVPHPSAVGERPAVASVGLMARKGARIWLAMAQDTTIAVLLIELFIIYSYCCHASNSGMAC